jgi:predicted alpha/beta hydrolase family esterase
MIHGNGGGTGEGCWFPWVADTLRKMGFDVQNPTMPDNVEAKSHIWLPYMEHELAVGHDTIVIGHSSGAVAAMRYAESHKIHGSILVGACYTDLGEESERISGYYTAPWHWGHIKDNQKWIVQFASQDDPFIPIKEARHIHQELDSEYHEYTDREHFGWPTDIKEFPELLEVIERKCKSKGK